MVALYFRKQVNPNVFLEFLGIYEHICFQISAFACGEQLAYSSPGSDPVTKPLITGGLPNPDSIE